MDQPLALIMIVDREPLLRWTLAELAREAGAVVLEAPDVATAVRQARALAAAPDLLFVECPGSRPDLPLCALVAHMPAAARAVGMVAFGDDPPAACARAEGMEVWVKPLNLTEVRALIADTIRRLRVRTSVHSSRACEEPGARVPRISIQAR